MSERKREIGVRIAIGARLADVAWLVVADGAALVTSGLALGIPGALGAGRLIRAQISGVEPAAPHVLLLVCVVLVGPALVATLLPAIRASRVDPIATQRAN